MHVHIYLPLTNIAKKTNNMAHPCPPPQKLGAKLVGGLHKPNDQTSILPSALLPFLRPLPIRSLPGVGHHMEGVLKGVGVERVEQMEALSLSMLRKTYPTTLSRSPSPLSLPTPCLCVTALKRKYKFTVLKPSNQVLHLCCS